MNKNTKSESVSASPQTSEGKEDVGLETPTALGEQDASRQAKFPDVLTPKQRAKYEAALKEIEADLKEIRDEIERSTRLTAKDYAVTINAR